MLTLADKGNVIDAERQEGGQYALGGSQFGADVGPFCMPISNPAYRDPL